jgi:hypothetical protein
MKKLFLITLILFTFGCNKESENYYNWDVTFETYVSKSYVSPPRFCGSVFYNYPIWYPKDTFFYNLTYSEIQIKSEDISNWVKSQTFTRDTTVIENEDTIMTNTHYVYTVNTTHKTINSKKIYQL